MRVSGVRSYGTALFLLGAMGLQTAAVAQQTQEPPTVLVQEVVYRDIHPSFEHPGIIEALQTASIRPVISAQLIASHVTPGATVKEGDLLFELDPREFEFALAEAQANLELMKAQEGEYKLQLERSQTLVERQTVAQSDLDLATAKYNAALAQIHAAQAAVDRAEKNLEDTKIYAPFDGRISASYYAVGDFVAPTNPVEPEPLAEMVKLDPIYVLGYISQSVYGLFLERRAQMAEAGEDIPELELSMTLPTGRDYPEKGKFVSWDFQAAADRGSIAARAEFPNPDGILLPGMNVRIHGQSIEALHRLVVPQRAVGQDQQGRFVYVVGDDGTVERRTVEMGLRDGPDWTVISGLEEGEYVIVEGLQKARPGATVTPEPIQE